MAQEPINKIEAALAKSLDEIDKLYTRKIQGDMHRCAAACCDRSTDSLENVYNCIKMCSTDFDKVRRYLQAEYGQFQSRFHRCVLHCGDEAMDKLGLNPSPSDVARYNRDYEKCVISCSNQYMDMIPTFMKRMKDVLSKRAYLNIQLEDDPKGLRPPTLL